MTLKPEATSIDGVTADLSWLLICTCKAHEDFGSIDCEAGENVPNASLCCEMGSLFLYQTRPASKRQGLAEQGPNSQPLMFTLDGHALDSILPQKFILPRR